jgi:hypothetical protein
MVSVATRDIHTSLLTSTFGRIFVQSELTSCDKHRLELIWV